MRPHILRTWKHRRRVPGLFLRLALLLMLLLAACGGDGDDDSDQPAPDGTPPPVDGGPGDAVAPQDGTPLAPGTEVFGESLELTPREPGVFTQTGLTLVDYSQGTANGRGYFFAEVRNDANERLSLVENYIYTLDEFGYVLDLTRGDALVTEIPAGTSFYVGTSFAIDEYYADAQIWLRYEQADPQTRAFFGLPVTVEYHGPASGMQYVVRGTVENTTGQPLYFQSIDVALIGPDDNLVGLSRGILATAAADGTWAAGEVASFEAPFFYLAVDPELVTAAHVKTAGYAILRDE